MAKGNPNGNPANHHGNKGPGDGSKWVKRSGADGPAPEDESLGTGEPGGAGKPRRSRKDPDDGKPVMDKGRWGR